MRNVCYPGKLLTLLIFLQSVVYGQDMPKVIPPSPEAAALFRFQDYPMDYSTGLPEISIPIYNVTSGSLSVPISISYHASGRRVMDEDGPVALGWSLNAGGMISRTIYGSPDFGTPTNGTYYFPYPFKTTGFDNSNSNDLRYLQKIMHLNNPDEGLLPWTESEYDIFSYNFGNKGGKFIFKDVNNVKTPVLLPYKPYIITPYYTFRGLTGIDIIDDKGILYQFTSTESSGPDNDYAVTSYSVTKIISADKTDTISFQYTGFAKWTKSFSPKRTWTTDWDMNPTPAPPAVAEDDGASQGVYQVQRLKEIDYKQGKILFNLVSGSDKIDNIQVINLNNEVLKTVQLNRSVMDALTEGGTSLISGASQVNNKLDAIVFKDKGGIAIENYSFEYYPTVFYSPQTTVNVHYCDYWGYYNSSGTTNMVPSYTITGIQIGGPDFNRLPDLPSLKSGVLKKITYPTGGSTSFSYENNKYADPSYTPGLNGPGLRIAQITSTDNYGNNTVKTYKYGVGEVGYGFLDLKPDITTMASYVGFIYFGNNGYSPGNFGGHYSEYTFFSNFITALNALGSRPVIYTEVAEYLGTPANNIGKTIYQYDNYAWAPAGLAYFGAEPIVKKHVSNWNFWNNPSLISKTDYKSTVLPGAGLTYSPRKNITNNYIITNLDDVAGLHVQRLLSFPQTGVATQYNVTAEVYATQYDGNSAKPYTFSDYHIPVGVKNLNFSIQTVYNDDGSSVSNIKTYAYNSRQYVNKTTTNTSDGNTIVNTITYPFDYPAVPVYTQMAAAPLNMLDFPIEQTETKNSIPIKSVGTSYLNWGTGVPRIYPQTIDVKKGANNYETRLRYYGYDSDGNPLGVSKENDLLTSYIWGYNNSYPVAEVKNANSNEIFFNSFEEGAGWDANLTAYDNTKSHCGKYSGRIDKPTAGEQVSLGSKWLTIALIAPTRYRYSGWVYSNGPSADIYLLMKRAGEPGSYTYIDGITNSQTGKWVFVEKEFSVPADVTQLNMRIDNNGGGTVWYDDMRISPSAAFMTTYTYDPLIGMTSSTDLNNLSSFYEYDLFGRLKLIRDINGNIIKTFSYQYQSSTP